MINPLFIIFRRYDNNVEWKLERMQSYLLLFSSRLLTSFLMVY
jgi:hypothetical protein